MTFPIGIGKEGWQTPLGVTKIILKRKNPSWIPPSSIRKENPDLPEIVPPGPNNPMGEYALSLGFHSIAIHGTNRPYGIGLRSSHGCIRMYPEDIEVLFNAIHEGEQVTIIDEPYKLGWLNNTLFLEVTPTQQQSDDIYEYKQPVQLSIPEIYDKISYMTGTETDIKWVAIENAISERTGIPIPVFIRKDSVPAK